MKPILFAWIGRTDLRAMTEPEVVGLGPIAQAIESHDFGLIELITNYPENEIRSYIHWLGQRTSTKVELSFVHLTTPTDFGEIYRSVVEAIEKRSDKQEKPIPDFWFHLSPGTPAMAAVWIILSKTRFPATLIESSKEQGVKIVNLPFDISAEFIPDLLRSTDKKLEYLSAGLPPESPEFDEIIHRSQLMKGLIKMARQVALRSVPILIEGESGTGKELFARAIHRASLRHEKPFVAVNCGAIHYELMESELFGHKKGSFTGAVSDHAGVFERAKEGTLFLDEISEIPTSAQVKFLRVLQEGTFVRVGDETERKTDVRVIAATNRSLLSEVAAGRFREDLFYRLAVGVLKIPPLRERSGDMGLLIDHFLNMINKESSSEPGFKPRKLSPRARNLLLQHSWPGNARELQNTLRRAVIWSSNETIDINEIKSALFVFPQVEQTQVLGRPLGEGLDIRQILTDVARHYLDRAVRESGGNKSKAAELVGLPSYQTFTNWLQKHGVRLQD
jgi:DNA-binding NtrC family response regulator